MVDWQSEGDLDSIRNSCDVLLTTHYANDCTSAKPGKGCNLRQRYTRPVEARCTSWQVQPSALITGICKTDNRFTSRVNSGQMSGKNMKSGAAKNGDDFAKGDCSPNYRNTIENKVELKSKPNWSSWRVGSTIQAAAGRSLGQICKSLWTALKKHANFSRTRVRRRLSAIAAPCN